MDTSTEYVSICPTASVPVQERGIVNAVLFAGNESITQLGSVASITVSTWFVSRELKISNLMVAVLRMTVPDGVFWRGLTAKSTFPVSPGGKL